ncbi:MAG: 4a-hydroxytetrahydrobiopterin dehydratase [Vicinamibacteria bacterium]
MAKLKALKTTEVVKRLSELEGWTLSREALRCQFRFETFKKAIQFVNKVADMAEAADHHPDIDIRFSLVKLALSTHDAKGITEKDFALAKAIDRRSVSRKSV